MARPVRRAAGRAVLLAVGITSAATTHGYASPDRFPALDDGRVRAEAARDTSSSAPDTVPGPSPIPAPFPALADLMLYQLRIDTFTPEGTFSAARQKLSYLYELGVTGVLLTPITEIASVPRVNFYQPKELDRIHPGLGTEEDFKAFVEQAHALGIRVLIDIVLHSVHPTGSLVTQHPDWFWRDPQGNFVVVWDGGYAPDWSNAALRAWYESVAVDSWVGRFNLDGFRGDLEPFLTGYDLWRAIRSRCAAAGHPIVVFKEHVTGERQDVYDFSSEDFGVLNNWKDFGAISPPDLMNGANIVDEIKHRGRPYLYYTSALSTHDRADYVAKARPVFFGYGLLFQPFIPVWFMGEEFDARNNVTVQPNGWTHVLYFSRLSWEDLEAHRSFLELVKRMIAIRKQYKATIAPMDIPLEQLGIAAVDAQGTTDLPPYLLARAGQPTILVAGKKAMLGGDLVVSSPALPAALGPHDCLSFTNLLTGSQTVRRATGDGAFPLEPLASWDSAIYRVEAADCGTAAWPLAESITAGGRAYNFAADSGDAAWAANGMALSAVPRYAAGPCSGQPADACNFDTRTFVTLFGQLVESVTAYGKSWNWWVDAQGNYAPAEQGLDLDAVPRFHAGPCAYKPPGGPCAFETRTFVDFDGKLIESITAYGRYWNFDAYEPWTAWPTNGSLLSEVSRYADGPCHDRPGAQCRWDSRTFAVQGGQLVEIITALGRLWKWSLTRDPQGNFVYTPTAESGSPLAAVERFARGPCVGQGECVLSTYTFVAHPR